MSSRSMKRNDTSQNLNKQPVINKCADEKMWLPEETTGHRWQVSKILGWFKQLKENTLMRNTKQAAMNSLALWDFQS